MHRSLIVEFIGTFFLCLIATMARSEWALAGMVAAMTYVAAGISGAHFNPAITVAVFLRGKISQPEGLRYLMAQGAAAVAAVLVGLIWYSKTGDVKAPSVTMEIFFKSLIGETLAVFAVTFVYLMLMTVKSFEGNSYFGIAIGLAVLAVGSAFSASLNPAVALSVVLLQNVSGAAIVTCLLGSAIGAFGGAFVVNLLQDEKISVPKDSSAVPPTQI